MVLVLGVTRPLTDPKSGEPLPEVKVGRRGPSTPLLVASDDGGGDLSKSGDIRCNVRSLVCAGSGELGGGSGGQGSVQVQGGRLTQGACGAGADDGAFGHWERPTGRGIAAVYVSFGVTTAADFLTEDEV